jgi:hypothetical protein
VHAGCSYSFREGGNQIANRPGSRLSGSEYSAANLERESTEDYYYEAQHTASGTKIQFNHPSVLSPKGFYNEGLFQDYIGGGSPYERVRGES